MRGKRTRRVIGTLVRSHAHRDWRHVLHWLGSIAPGRLALEDGVPWLPYRITDLLAERTRPEMSAFEYGTGGSTVWLAERVSRIVSVEHDLAWAERVAAAVRARGTEERVTLLQIPPVIAEAPSIPEVPIRYASALAAGDFQTYARAIDSYPSESFDVIIIDGRSRAACLVHAISKVRPGGVLVLDDSDRPRYAAAIQAVPGWQRHDVVGLRPYSELPGRATAWIRPS